MDNLFYSKNHNLVFISNPKVACSTIKFSLLHKVNGANINTDNVHTYARDFLGFPHDMHVPFFAITRNPYSRILSAYKEKIVRKELSIWPLFCKKYNLDRQSQPSFYTVLTKLSQDTNPRRFDPHFRPQVYNLHINDITPMFIGRLERMDEVQAFLAQYGVDMQTKAPHATQSSLTYTHEISKEEEKLINQIYEKDFLAYDYTMELCSDYIPNSVYQKQKVSKRMRYMKNYSAYTYFVKNTIKSIVLSR